MSYYYYYYSVYPFVRDATLFPFDVIQGESFAILPADPLSTLCLPFYSFFFSLFFPIFLLFLLCLSEFHFWFSKTFPLKPFLFVSLCLCVFVGRCFCPSVCLSVCLSAFLSLFLSFFLSLSLSHAIFLPLSWSQSVLLFLHNSAKTKHHRPNPLNKTTPA